jgi:hypothetical protein
VRRAPVTLVLSALLTPLVVALPAAAPSAAAPEPVPASVTEIPVPASSALARQDVGAPTAPLAELPQRSTQRFSTVGVTWALEDGVGDVTAEVRTRSSESGGWSDWVALDTDAEHGPDPDSPEYDAEYDGQGLRGGSAPLWVGPSDGVQVRVAGVSDGRAPRDVQVALVDPGEGSADGNLTGARAGTAHSATPAPEVVLRAQWGADERYNTCQTAYSPSAKVGFVHHTAGRNDYTREESAAVVRGIYAFHTQSRGWCDLGYNFLIDRWGRIFEGRAGGIDKVVVGAHTGGFNSNSFSGSLMGTFATEVPPAAMLESLERLFAWKLGRNHRDPTGTQELTSAGGGTSKYPAGQKARFNVISGHRDAGNTSCPGDQTYARMGEIRSKTRAYLGAGFTDPEAKVTQRTPNGPGSATISAGLLQPTAWELELRAPGGDVVRRYSGTSTTAVRVEWDLRDSSGRLVPPQDYQATLTGNGGEVPWSAPVAVGQPPTGRLDEARMSKGASESSLELRGWALDPDTSEPVTVRLYLDGRRVAEVVADDDRPDIAAAYPGYGAAHGFTTTVTEPNGQYVLVTKAVDGDSTRETQLDERTVVLGEPPKPPAGAYDTVRREPGVVRVTGWAVDPNTDEPTTVDVLVDGRVAGTLTADRSRPDVTMYGDRGTRSGYDGTVSISPGDHAVCVTARLADRSGDGTELGCRPVRVLAGSAPRGVIDLAGNAGEVQGVRVAGWTLDPDSAASTDVHVYVGSRGVNIGGDRDRPDIAKAFPGYGAAHGFDVTVPAPVGRHRVCAYAINYGPGSSHTLLGCQDVTVAVQPYGAFDGASRTADGGLRVHGWDADVT